MVFGSSFFLMFFLPFIMLIYYNPLVKSRKYKNIVLLLASLVFYAWGEPVFVFILCVSIIINWLLGIGIGTEKRKYIRKGYLILTFFLNVGLLFIFKYLTFVTEIMSKFISVEKLEVALPIGISFYTFQIMSYIFDVYYEKVEYQKSLEKVALYVLLFPQLVAGPIVRYKTIADEIDNRQEKVEDFCIGIRRFIIGLGKKILIADMVGVTADNIFFLFENSGGGGIVLWIGAIAYTLQIYFDFSGYSDMAIGLGRCFGFHFEENFNYPYIARSVTEFWKRWHISLTNWFRDYVYVPLGGNRVSAIRHIMNLFVVWMLTGIWHGANWTFLVWGLTYYLIQLLEKKFILKYKIPFLIGYIYTMLIVIVNWVIFRADNLSMGLLYIREMFRFDVDFINANFIIYMKSNLILFIVAMLGCLPWKQLINKVDKKNHISRALEIIEIPIVIAIVLMVFFFVIDGSYSPFIYFNF